MPNRAAAPDPARLLASEPSIAPTWLGVPPAETSVELGRLPDPDRAPPPDAAAMTTWKIVPVPDVVPPSAFEPEASVVDVTVIDPLPAQEPRPTTSSSDDWMREPAPLR